MKRFLFTFAFLLLPSLLWAASGGDDFGRGNVDPLDGPWVIIAGLDQPRIINQKVGVDFVNSGVGAAYFTGFTTTANQEATLTLATFTGSDEGHVGLMLRKAATPELDDLYLCLARKNDSGGITSSIGEIVGGFGSLLASESATTWASTDTIRCKVENDVVTLYRNGSGTPLLTGNSASISSGKPGLFVYESFDISNNEVDNFSASDDAPAPAGAARRRVIIIE